MCGLPLHVRVGVHVGDVCAAFVGRDLPRYHIYGEASETAALMEAAAERDSVALSAAAAEALAATWPHTRVWPVPGLGGSALAACSLAPRDRARHAVMLRGARRAFPLLAAFQDRLVPAARPPAGGAPAPVPATPATPAATPCAREAGAPPPPPLPPSLPYKVDTSRPALRTNWTRLVPFPQVAGADDVAAAAAGLCPLQSDGESVRARAALREQPASPPGPGAAPAMPEDPRGDEGWRGSPRGGRRGAGGLREDDIRCAQPHASPRLASPDTPRRLRGLTLYKHAVPCAQSVAAVRRGAGGGARCHSRRSRRRRRRRRRHARVARRLRRAPGRVFVRRERQRGRIELRTKRRRQQRTDAASARNAPPAAPAPRGAQLPLPCRRPHAGPRAPAAA